MGLADRVAAERARLIEHRAELAWSTGAGSVDPGSRFWGHDDSVYSPQEYGDYLATSNEVYSAASLRARLMSGLRLKLFAGRREDKQEITTGPAYDLLRYVNPFWTQPRLARMDELCMCLWGKSFWAVERDPVTKRPAEIWWMKPTRVKPIPDENDYLVGFWYEPLSGGPRIPFDADEVVWFRYPNPVDEFGSSSPLAPARLAADTSSAMMKSNRNLFTQGMQAGGFIVPDKTAGNSKVTFSTQQAQELEQHLEKRLSGVDKAHRWAVLRYEAKFLNPQITQKDAEFVEGLQLTARQVWNAYGIPAPLLNDLAHATLANTREYERILWSLALVPDAELRAADVEQQFLPMFGRRAGRPATADHAEYDFGAVPALQESQSAAWARERQAIEVGALKINEWRKRQGLPPVPWGDVWWAPVNKSAVTGAGSTPQGDTSPTGQPVDAEQAAQIGAAIDVARLELRHGQIRLNGHKREGSWPVGAR